MTEPRSRVLRDGTRIREWTHRPAAEGGPRPEVVLLHGGPGLPDYLEEPAAMIEDLAIVHRYDQRGTGGSDDEGSGSLDRHLKDLEDLLDAWSIERALLVGHSFGTDLAVRFADRHPDRVERMLLVAGPFTGDWRDAYRVERRSRMSDRDAQRLDELEGTDPRSEDEEVELLTLAWSTDHADAARGRAWAADAARRRRPVAWAMNRALGRAAREDPIEGHLDVLSGALRGRVALIGGARDPRPAEALAGLAAARGLPLTLIDGAGHEPWRERPERVRALLREFVRVA